MSPLVEENTSTIDSEYSVHAPVIFHGDWDRFAPQPKRSPNHVLLREAGYRGIAVPQPYIAALFSTAAVQHHHNLEIEIDGGLDVFVEQFINLGVSLELPVPEIRDSRGTLEFSAGKIVLEFPVKMKLTEIPKYKPQYSPIGLTSDEADG